MRLFFFLRRNSKRKFVGAIFRKLYRLYCLLYSSSIPLNVNIPCSTNFPHGIHGVFISMNAQIGENCTIYHQVTIGSILDSKHVKFGAPVIKNNCFIGVGAKIIGNIIINSDVKIGANCVVVKDVCEKSTVVSAKNIVINRM
ncbi:hypothetical protein KW486_17155 [Vibrio fluvialis]|nr:hypothetical protein [Vibrio fluvialis]MBY8052214.1 hypothetical protein [Vibrio fluvialis]